MSGAGGRGRRRLMAEINVVPYIDVMLVLLVIFMITAPMLTQGVQVDLPQAASEPVPAAELEPLVVTVDAQGRYYLNVGEDPRQPLTQEVLLHRVAAVLRRQPRTPVLVRGDAEASYGQVVRVMALLQRAGVRGVGLLTRPEG